MSMMSSASRCRAIERRQNTPRSMPSWVSRTSWYGPAHSAVMYVLMRTDLAKCTTFAGSPSTDSSRSIVAFEIIRQCAGAVTCQTYSPFRSGWSKQA
jgi:hypothetical protein